MTANTLWCPFVIQNESLVERLRSHREPGFFVLHHLHYVRLHQTQNMFFLFQGEYLKVPSNPKVATDCCECAACKFTVWSSSCKIMLDSWSDREMAVGIQPFPPPSPTEESGLLLILAHKFYVFMESFLVFLLLRKVYLRYTIFKDV